MQRFITRPALLHRLTVRPLMATLKTPIVSTTTRTLSSTPVSFAPSAAASQLASSLANELKYETENAAPKEPAVESFLGNGVWKLKETKGHKEVCLTRTFEDETIKVFFSTDAVAELKEAEESGDEEDIAGTIPLTVVVTRKSAPGGMELQVTLDETDYLIDQVSYFKDAKLALDETAEGDWRRQEAYGGPIFDDLDDKVKTAFTEFLAERGFDNELSEFIPAYLDFKEQAEYVNWIEGMHSFVSAK